MNTTVLKLILCFLPFAFGAAQASDLITYQGKLTDAASLPLPDGQYRLGVRIWDVAEGGETPLWARKYDVPVNAGVFSLMIGAEGLPWGTVGQIGGPMTASLKLALSGTSRFVEITVMSDAGQPEKPDAQWHKLAPRQALGAVPYAMNGVPTGTVVPFAGATAPEGWLICDGSGYISSDPRYHALALVLGNQFGGGASTFRVPDLMGRVPVGAGVGDSLTSRLRGQKIGTETHTLTLVEMPSHNHGGTTGGAGAHSHTFGMRRDGNGGSTQPEAGDGNGQGTATTSAVPDHSHSISSQGGNQPHNNMQPSLVLNYIIKL